MNGGGQGCSSMGSMSPVRKYPEVISRFATSQGVKYFWTIEEG